MKLIEIKAQDKQAQKEFLMLPVRLYKNEKNWIRPLDDDIESIFDPQKNPCFQFGDCIRWLLKDDKNQTIGRVAAFYDSRNANAGDEQPTGGMGFFECINDQKAAFMLFDACKDWLVNKNMEAMDGPVNFGDRSRWWGLLVEGFDPPNYCVPYNFAYYKAFFENYGFKDYFQQYTYRRFMSGPMLDDKFFAKAERLRQNKAYSFEHIKKNNLDKYVEDFRTVYNASWVKHEGVAEMTKEEVKSLMTKLKPVIDEQLIWFAYYNEQPIAFMVMIPELNQFFKYVNGKLDFWGKLKFVYYKWKTKRKKILGLVIGVVPRFHGRGLESAIIVEFSPIAYSKDFKYEELEFNWVGDFLPAMMHVYETMEAKIVKTHITYRKLFDETREFKRHPVIK